MSRANRGIAAITAAWLVFVSPGSAEEKCALVRVTSVDMRTGGGGGVYVPITIAGRNINLLIDTGGTFSMLTKATIDALSLSASQIPRGTRMTMFGGLEITQYTTAHDIEFGGLKAPKLDFLVMPDGRLPSDMGGTLAPDVLRSYDDEFDFAGAKFSLFEPHTCSGNIAYWTNDPHVEIPFHVDPVGHIEFSVTLDGEEVRATLDTGASRSVMELEAAQDLFRFGKRRSSIETAESTESLRANNHSFKSLVFGQSSGELGTVTVNNPDLQLISKSDSKMGGMPPIILGMGILRQLHLYIAYKEKTLYVTAASAH